MARRIIKIPMKHHVKQYMIARYGEVPHATFYNIIGLTLYGTCSHVRMNRSRLHDILDKSLLSVSLTTNHLKHKYWDKDRLIRAGKILEKHFDEMLITFVDAYQMQPDSRNIHGAVRTFCDMNGITEDMISVDTLRKLYRSYLAKTVERE